MLRPAQTALGMATGLTTSGFSGFPACNNWRAGAALEYQAALIRFAYPGCRTNCMNANDILLLALKRKVTAIARSDGRHIWCTEIRGGSVIDAFITLACDDSRVFAYCGGHLHCLELSSGRLLWTDELPGYGFRLASLCVPGHGSAPDTAALKHLMAQRNSAAASSASIAAT